MKMTIIHQPASLQEYIQRNKERGLSVGFVPTMGALHQGHLQLVDISASATDLTVCSIFVNPTQFNDPEDYKKYPNRLENDILLLSHSPADVLFIPPAESIYPDGRSGLKSYQLGYLESLLEGKFRPGHFQGVCQVMDRLLNIVQPNKLFMGQKDYQQCMVVKSLLTQLDLSTTLITCPTRREPDGLAMSSRNLRLLPELRLKAAEIYRTLNYIKDHLEPGNVEEIRLEAQEMLQEEGFRVDYIAVADADTLQPVTNWDGFRRLVILSAAFLGEVRLIDNILTD